MAKEPLQGDEVHPGRVGNPTERPPKIVVGYVDSGPAPPCPSGCSLERRIRPGSGQGNHRVVLRSAASPTGQDAMDLGLHRNTAPLPAATAFPEDSKASFLHQNVLDAKPQDFDPPKPMEPLESNDHPLHAPCMTIARDELVSSEPPAAGGRCRGQPPQRSFRRDWILTPAEERSERLKVNRKGGFSQGKPSRR